VGRFSELEKTEAWDRFEPAESLRSISCQLGRAPSSVRIQLRRTLMVLGWDGSARLRYLGDDGTGICRRPTVCG
jgi:hypothetical protein